DIRNSKVVDIINEMKDFGATVEVIDPGADAQEVKHEYGLELAKEPAGQYDAVIAAVSHKEYTSLDENYFASLLVPGGVLVDIKGIYRKKVKNLNYWSL
ncbi:MAG: nucleotide sugar dehydrogenase, partial [Bacteroidales bacterium]|nr:nucleotide sugar dehydrogenase [Bacteroidales bacterium]